MAVLVCSSSAQPQTPSTKLTPAAGCARGDGVPAELCALALATHPLTAVTVTPFLSAAQCDRFIAAAEAAAAKEGEGRGWRSLLRYDTREVPLVEIPELVAWYEATGRHAIEELLRSHHLPVPVPAGDADARAHILSGGARAHPRTERDSSAGARPVRDLSLTLRESNVVKYEEGVGVGVEDGSSSVGVRPHTDGEDVFTFNVLLSRPADFDPTLGDEGGGGESDGGECGGREGGGGKGEPPSGSGGESAGGTGGGGGEGGGGAGDGSVLGLGAHVGTYFAHLNRTVTARQGDVVVYYGGQVHSSGGTRLKRGRVRYIWQGFVGFERQRGAGGGRSATLVHAHGAEPQAAALAAEKEDKAEDEDEVEEGEEEEEGEGDGGKRRRARILDAIHSAIEKLAPPLARAAVAAFPEDGTLLANLCAVLGRAAEAGAVGACRAALEAGPSAGAYNNLALVLQGEGDVEGAEAALRRGLELLGAGSQRERADTADSGSADTGGADTGRHLAGRAAAAAASGPPPPPAAAAAVAAAGSAAGKAAAAAPELAELWTNLGALLGTVPGREAEAVSASEAAVALSPDSAQLHSNLGAQLQRLDRLADARRVYAHALALDPRAVSARFNLAVLLLKGGEPEEAALHFGQLLRARPADEEARRGLVRALVDSERYDEAIELSREGARRARGSGHDGE
jgi:tetratricopeptide (TPR) repeat protein